MRYIKEIRLKNFQSHKNTKLLLGPKQNVIVGPSDSGKTSVIRALKWLFYNGLRGTEFIREGETNSMVSVKYNDGYEIIRKRNTSNENSYTIIYPDGEEEKFDSVGTKVPLEVIEITGIEEIELSGIKGYINMAEQLEGPFLLNESPNTKSKVLGDLIGIDIIEDAMTNLRRDRLNLNREIDYLNKEKLKKDEELKKFSYLEDLRKNLEIANNDIIKLEEKIEDLSNLNKLAYAYKNNLEFINNIKSQIASMPDINSLEDILEKLELKFKNHKILENIFIRDNNLSKIIIENKKTLSSYEDLDIVVENVAEIENKVNKLNQIKEKYYLIKQLDNSIIKLENILNSLKDIGQADNNLKSLREYIMKYERFNNIKFSLINLNENIQIIEKELIATNNILKTDEKLELIQENLLNLKTLKNYNERLKVYNKNIQSLNINIEEIDKYYKDRLENYRDILLNLKVCPYCHSSLDSQHIDEIIQNI